VTPAGLAALDGRLKSLAETLAAIPLLTENPDQKELRRRLERDIRYYEGRRSSAVLVDNAGNPPGDVRFGAVVEVDGEDGVRRSYAIVGDDEADAAAGRISWGSPLAGALFGLKPGDFAEWEGGRLKVVSLRY
jgi:transcription elongation GreA/GreB family factor